jgi:hypothetical protein
MVTAAVCIGIPVLVLVGSVVNRLLRSVLLVGLGIALTPFWLLGSIMLLIAPVAGLIPQASRRQLALAATANPTKIHIVVLGFVAMVIGVVVCIIASRRDS